jgi:hypothetical protein
MTSLRCAEALCMATLMVLLVPCHVFWLPHFPGCVAAAAMQKGSSDSLPIFAYLSQLTEAVLAPVWGTGGYAYALSGLRMNSTSSLRPICLHTRTASSVVTAPFTPAMFDVQFSPVYEVAVDNASARVIGQLDLQRSCYTSFDAPDTCVAALMSSREQCAFGSDDALYHNWTADALKPAEPAAPTGSEGPVRSVPLPASGLSAAELFTVFLNDYLPQRAWLRTAVPRSVDLLSTAMQAAAAFYGNTPGLTAGDEVADMQQAVTSEWNRYLWNVYGPQLRRKWDLLYQYAVATLHQGSIAPPLRARGAMNGSANSVSGIPGPVLATTCPLMDVWLQLRYNPADMNVTRLTQLIKAAVGGLANALAVVRRGGDIDAGKDAAEVDALLFRLVRNVYCVTTTNLFSLTALLDRPFLLAVSSVWVDMANHSDSWAWQTMQTASLSAVVGDATAFQRAAAAQMDALSSSLSTVSEKALLSCIARFLDPTTPLTSTTRVSPSNCVWEFLETRDGSASIADNFTTLFDAKKLSEASVTDGVPGVTRYESVEVLPSTSESTGASLQWFVVQERARCLTAQTSVFTPAVASPSSRLDTCALTAQNATPESAWDWIYECPAGTFVTESNATCATCPSACAASTSSASMSFTSSAFPVYCPGDGLLHGCPPRPTDAIYTGSTSGGQTGPSAICRYACADVYTAPMNYSCLSVGGLFFNSSASGNADANNGGGLSPCVGPTSLFPPSAPVRSQTRLYTFVGSGATDAPLTCRFTLHHRATSSAITQGRLQTVGLLPPSPFPAPSGTSSGVSALSLPPVAPLTSHTAVTWEAEVQLNATLMHQVHTTLRRSLEEHASDQDTDAATATTVAHELVGVWKAPSSTTDSGSASAEAERVLSWYLFSTLNRTDSDLGSSAVHLRLLVNLSVISGVSGPAGDAAHAVPATPAPSSLILCSPAWLWLPWSGSATSSSALSTFTFRVVLNRHTNSVAFYVNGSMPLSDTPVVMDWPHWTSTTASTAGNDTTAAVSTKSSFFLAVGGWVAGYGKTRQWVLAANRPASSSPASTGSTAADYIALPLFYDYVPGMVTRVSTAASLIDPFQSILRVAERAWQVEADAGAAAQGQLVAQLTLLVDLVHYVAPTPLVAASVSAALAAMAQRATQGLDGVCRPGYGVSSTSATGTACEVCMAGGYTVMDPTAVGSNGCACIPQRVRGVKTEAMTNQRVGVCQTREAGPAAPYAHLTELRTLYVDGSVEEPANATASCIPLGWYAATDAVAGSINNPQSTIPTTSLTASVVCTYGLTSPRTTAAAGASSDTRFNTSVALQYTTGLGGETCEARAAARGGSVLSAPLSFSADGVAAAGAAANETVMAKATKPTYTDTQTYKVRLQAPALTTAAVAFENNSALFTDQTVFAIGVRGYALLSFYSTNSLLRMRQLTEYHLSFLAYVLRSATVSAELTCEGKGKQQREGTTRVFTWANESALATSVLWLNLTHSVTRACVLTLRVSSAAVASSDSAVPFASWPYSYLRLPSSFSPSSFFENSTTLTYVVQAPSAAFTTLEKHHVLGELSSFLMASCILFLSLVLGVFYAISDHAPTLDLLSWRRYELEMAKTLSFEEDH